MKPVLLVLLCSLTGTLLSQPSGTKKIDSLFSAANYQEAKKVIIQLAASSSNVEETCLLSNRLAEILMMEGNFHEAETTLQSMLQNPSIRDPSLKAVTKTNLGFLYLNKARNDLALEQLQQALDLFRQSGIQAASNPAQEGQFAP